MKTNQSIRPGCSHNVVGFALNSNRDAGSLRNALAFVLMMLGLSAVFASQLTLSKTPPISGGVEPRPNVIVTVDDSGSMDKDINGNSTSTSAAKKITLLKNALNASFGSTDVLPDGRVRLAWQSMHDNGEFISGNGAQSIKLGAINSMKTFTGPHRTNFSSFVNGLRPGDYTPSIDMMKNVYTYLNAPENVQSPWADDPTAGTAQTTPYLACRRTFHIFMTDGLWNSQEFPSCSAGGTNSGTAANPVCNNSKITCPTGYSFKSNFDPNKVCRKGKKNNYQYTAGFWSENTSIWTTADRVDKGDGVSQTLPDLEQYEAVSTNAQVRAYRDIYGDDPAYSSTLSDFVFRNWATDLQDGRPGITQVNSAGTTISGNTQDMENAINPVLRKKDDEVVTVSGGTTTLQPYWNPKNDPATWQHVTQYMIGFGTEATDWGGVAPVWGGNTFGGDYAKLVNGVVAWPNVRTDSTSTSVSARAAELWHGAINGRGKYIPASSGDALVQAFKDILVDVIKDTSQPLITVTTSSSTLKAGTLAYVAGYKAENWAGQLFARPLNAVDKTVDIATTWDAANLLDASTFSVADRLVVSHNGTEGISWKTYSLLPDAQKNQLNRNATAVDNKGQDRVDYIRGDRTKEQAQTNGIFRDRNSRLGDIVNSNIWFVGRPASAYSDSAYATFRGTGPGGKGARTPECCMALSRQARRRMRAVPNCWHIFHKVLPRATCVSLVTPATRTST